VAQGGNGQGDGDGTRPRYPSDEAHNQRRRAKRRPSFFKLHTSFSNHPKTAAIFADDILFCCYLRLGLLAVEKGAAQTDDWVTLTRADLHYVFNAVDYRTVIKRAHALVAALEWKVRGKLTENTETRKKLGRPTNYNWDETRNVYEFHFRNFAKKQGFTPRKNGVKAADSAISPLFTNTKESYRNGTTRMRSDEKADEMKKLDEETKRKTALIVREIVELTGDDTPRSVSYFVHTVLELGEQITRRLISATKAAEPKSRARYFTTCARRELEQLKLAREIPL
jgi:hypothetical protein